MNPKLKITLRVIAILSTIAWMIVIFRLSMDTGVSSHELSSKCVSVFRQVVYQFTGKDLQVAISPSNYLLIEVFFRKLAHMFIYFILSISVMLLLFTFDLKMVTRIGLAMLFCFLYALSDEYHQLHVEGRGASFFDCIIDMGGVVFGIILALILYCILYTIMIKHQKAAGKIIVRHERRRGQI